MLFLGLVLAVVLLGVSRCPVIGMDLLARVDLLIARVLLVISVVLVGSSLFLVIRTILFGIRLCEGIRCLVLLCRIWVTGSVTLCRVVRVCLSSDLRRIMSFIAVVVLKIRNSFLFRLFRSRQRVVVLASSRNTGRCRAVSVTCNVFPCGGLGRVPGLALVSWCVVLVVARLLVVVEGMRPMWIFCYLLRSMDYGALGFVVVCVRDVDYGCVYGDEFRIVCVPFRSWFCRTELFATAVVLSLPV